LRFKRRPFPYGLRFFFAGARQHLPGNIGKSTTTILKAGAARTRAVSKVHSAGKGPGIVIQSRTGSGAVRVAPREKRNEAVVELLDASGGITQIRLSGDELRLLAAQLMKVAAHLQAMNLADEVTQI